MALLLHIESSGQICSVCISRGADVLCLKKTEEAFQHTEYITLLIAECVKEVGINLKDLDAVSISRGPGSYTSLRVGTATAKGICYALDKPLIEVDTLESLALAAFQKTGKKTFYCPMIDARRMEVYTAVFDENQSLLFDYHALIVTEEAFSAYRKNSNKKIILCGDGAQKTLDILPAMDFEYVEIDCSAAWLVPIALAKFKKGEFADVAYFSPFYLKSPNITKPKKVL